MISPEMPTGNAVRQAVIDNESDSKFDDRVRVIGLEGSDGGGIDVEASFALATIVPRVSQNDFDRSTAIGIAEMSECSLIDVVSFGGAFAEGTGTFLADTGAVLDLRCWQIVGTDNFFGGVGQIFSGTRHGRILLDCNLKENSLPILSIQVNANLTKLMLHCPYFTCFRNMPSNSSGYLLFCR